MTKYIVAIVLALAGCVVEVQGQSPSSYIDTHAGISLEGALKRALEAEPSLRAVRADVDVSRAMRTQAALRSNPSLSIERREEPAGMDNQTMVGVTWPLDFGRRGARVAVAEREVEVVEQTARDRVRTLLSDVRMRYGQAAAAVRDAGVAEQMVTSGRRELELLRQRVEQGASPPLERDLLDVELRRFESARLLAAARANGAMFQLKRVLGMSSDTPLTLSQPLDALPVSFEVPQSETVARRSDVLEAEARVRLANARIERARSEGRVDFSLFGSYTRMDAGFPQLGINDAGHVEPIRGVFHYVAAGAMVMVPLWNRNQGEIAAAQAERAAAAARLEASELSAQADVAAAKTYAAEAAKAAEVIAEAVALARKNLEVMRQMYELGRSTLPDILVEQRRYLEIENAYTAALREAFEARTLLAFAQGELP